MHGDDATALPFWSDSFENDMTAALAVNEKSESLGRFDRLRA
jgi:hypothetical protein